MILVWMNICDVSIYSVSMLGVSISSVNICGVGICGACAAPDGQRICVDGPFLQGSPARPASL